MINLKVFTNKVMAQLRDSFHPTAVYLRTKLGSCCDKVNCTHSRVQFCGECFWQGVTIKPECILECSKCKIDTDAIKRQPEIEAKCCKNCLWWDFFDLKRRVITGCKCDVSDFYHSSAERLGYKIIKCKCGKLAYKERLPERK